MKRTIALFTLLLVPFAQAADPRPPSQIIAKAPAEHWRTVDTENMLYLDLERGRVVIELADAMAPAHAANIRALAREQFYDGLNVYRVIEGFVAQGGDQSGAKPVKHGKRTIPAEFSRKNVPAEHFTPLPGPDGYAPQSGFIDGFPAARDPATGESWLVHCNGAFAMAREQDIDSGGTEFYAVIGPAQRYLDRNTTVFGRVLEGIEVLQQLERGDKAGGILENPQNNRILRMRVAADVPQKERQQIEVLSTDSPSFAELIAARRNRPEDWFVARPNYVDVCSVGVPSRQKSSQ
ncbi:peptidylprolyl isomerase [Microbulbifer donghaiensis]|uniref:peptidylprolyl isomerase n=1 Tax=Microbulbifer donghaiensis TaxID=494016 RepID=A0A1M4UDL4_9GAMM|nr:peptidylprolyl isomerase [Microbulbifer donghaiensis]SHE54660.1 peptidylprolyl isomerase [Microbulbifer donghaiensis]